MTKHPSSPLARDKMKKAVRALAELIEQFPQKSRQDLLHEVELNFDLSPLECEFLNNTVDSRE